MSFYIDICSNVRLEPWLQVEAQFSPGKMPVLAVTGGRFSGPPAPLLRGEGGRMGRGLILRGPQPRPPVLAEPTVCGGAGKPGLGGGRGWESSQGPAGVWRSPVHREMPRVTGITRLAQAQAGPGVTPGPCSHSGVGVLGCWCIPGVPRWRAGQAGHTDTRVLVPVGHAMAHH